MGLDLIRIESPGECGGEVNGAPAEVLAALSGPQPLNAVSEAEPGRGIGSGYAGSVSASLTALLPTRTTEL
eukprot:7028450-Pyramimonas_sp.AAC.1